MEIIKDLAIVWVPFIILGVAGTIMQNRREHKEMRARHNKRFEEIKRNNRKRKIKGY